MQKKYTSYIWNQMIRLSINTTIEILIVQNVVLIQIFTTNFRFFEVDILQFRITNLVVGWV